MFIREFPRGIAVVAIAACVPMASGCASTNRFVVDPDLSTSMAVGSLVIANGTRTTFDAAGGHIDPLTMTVTGSTTDGEGVAVPVADVRQLYFWDDRDTHESIKTNPAALVDGDGWRPDGQIQYVALRSCEVVDVRKIPTTVDARNRAVLCAPVDGPASAIPFDQIVYVQIKDTHPGRTVLCVLVGGFFAVGIAAGIAMGSGDIGL